MRFWKKRLNDEDYLTMIEAILTEECLKLATKRKVEYIA
jgi:hypothetical protein